MTGMLSIILAANGLRDYGVCSFSDVEDKLLNCLAKGRLFFWSKPPLPFISCGNEREYGRQTI